MSSLFRFLTFLALLALAISALYFWRAYTLARTPVPVSTIPSSPVDVPLTNGAAAVFPATLATLAQLDRDFQSLVQKVRPSVVSITAENERIINQHQPRRLGTLRLPPNLGSGVIVSPQGHIVTNLHVIRGTRTINVHLYDGRSFPAAVVGADPLTDIAILAIEADNLQPLPFGDSDEVRPGQIVFAVGNPYGLQETVTQGIISGIGRRSSSETVNEFFQTDTAINPGNSGGPLLNLRGEIIGINNAIHTQTGGWQGISFSIPSNTAKRVFDDLRAHGRVTRTWFGVAWGRPLTPQLARQMGLSDQQQGVMIHHTVEGSPAEAAGLQPGDVIVEFNGRKIVDGIDLRNRVAESEVGQMVQIKALRGGRPVEFTVRLAEFPSA